MKSTKKLSLTLIISALFIAACGNKGDLFLPGQDGKNATEQTEPEQTGVRVRRANGS